MFHKDADKLLKLYKSAQFNSLDNKGKKGFENPPTCESIDISHVCIKHKYKQMHSV